MGKSKFGLVVLLTAALGACSGKHAKAGPGDAGAQGDGGQTGDAGGAGTDSDSDVDSDDCADLPFDLQLNPINMFIALDRSRSMLINQVSGKSFASVVATAIEELVQANEDRKLIHFGLDAFPAFTWCTCPNESPATVDCGLEIGEFCMPSGNANPGEGFTPPLVPIGSANLSSIEYMLGPSGIGTCGGTPICESLLWVENYLDSLSAEVKSRPTYVLLATDGAPNCNSSGKDVNSCTCPGHQLDGGICENAIYCLDDQCTKDQAEALKNKGYKVFVVGVGGEAATYRSVLDAIADKGGTGSAYDGSDPVKLKDAFDAITAEAVSCSYEIPWDDISSDGIVKACNKVRAYGVADQDAPDDKTPIPYSHDCSNPDGWRWKGLDKELDPEAEDTTPLDQCTAIELCEGACTSFKKLEYEQIAFGFGCKVIIVE